MDECFFGHKDALFSLVYSIVCFPYSSSKVVSMVGKFHDLDGAIMPNIIQNEVSVERLIQ